MRRVVAALLCFLPAVASGAPIAPPSGGVAVPRVRNLILFVGDGLGGPQRTVAHLQQGTPLVMETMPVVGVTTPAAMDGPAPDSASATTALATGHKTLKGQLSVGSDGHNLTTLLEAARQSGRGVGVVSNLSVTHASVAGFFTHATRRDEAGIELTNALDVVTKGPDVVLGGGESYFLPVDKNGRRIDARDLVNEARTARVHVVRTEAELQAQPPSSGKLLGLFGPGALSYELDRQTDNAAQPSLAQMTDAAIKWLAPNGNGFVLVVDEGHLDWACHDHDAAAATREVLALDDAVRVATEFAHGRTDTLLVVATSHDTSGLAIGPSFSVDGLRGARRSLEKVAEAIRGDRAHYEDTVKTLLGWSDLSTSEKEELVLASDPTKAAAAAGSGQDGLVLALGHIQAQRAGLGWASVDHTGNPCPLAAAGAQARGLAGSYDTTEVAHRVARVLQINLP